MRLRIGYRMAYESPQPTPMLLVLNVHYTRVSDLILPDHVVTSPATSPGGYRDGFGNWCTRIVAPAGELTISADALINDDGVADPVDTGAWQHLVEHLPDEVLVFLLGSRYCETDRLADTAWRLFADTPPGWARVQAICDFVHGHIRFGYENARASRTALEAYDEGVGVCRDYAHLAVAFCRCMNIPARYCTGYLADIGVPSPTAPQDFAAWMEVFLGGRWHIFDPRNNQRRIGRVLIARGRDAADVPISNIFGPSVLTRFEVVTDEVPAPGAG